MRKHRLRPLKVSLSIFILVSSMVGAMSRSITRDDEYAAVTQVQVLDYEAHDEKKPGSRVVLQVPRGFSSNDETQTTLLKLHVLYPDLEGFRPSRRADWYEELPNGQFGPHKPDVIYIFLEHSSRRSNDLSEGALKLLESDLIKKVLVPAKSPAFNHSDYSQLLAFRETWADDRITGERFLLRSKDDRQTVIRCYTSAHGMRAQCTALTTWQGILSVRYDFPRPRMTDIARIDKNIHRIVGSFEPRIKTGSR